MEGMRLCFSVIEVNLVRSGGSLNFSVSCHMVRTETQTRFWVVNVSQVLVSEILIKMIATNHEFLSSFLSRTYLCASIVRTA